MAGKTSMRKSPNLRVDHQAIDRQIAAVARAVLSFQTKMVSAAGAPAAEDTNAAIVLAARLSTVWKRVGELIPRRD